MIVSSKPKICCFCISLGKGTCPPQITPSIHPHLKAQHAKVIKEMWELYEMMQDRGVSKIKKYPKYLPSFDDFVSDFQDIEL
jgi:hypothetical protein